MNSTLMKKLGLTWFSRVSQPKTSIGKFNKVSRVQNNLPEALVGSRWLCVCTSVLVSREREKVTEFEREGDKEEGKKRRKRKP